MDCSGLNDCSEFTMDPLQTLQEGLTTMELELILQIRTLADAGVGIKAIARQLDLTPNTVRRYLRGADPGPHPRPNACAASAPSWSNWPSTSTGPSSAETPSSSSRN